MKITDQEIGTNQEPQHMGGFFVMSVITTLVVRLVNVLSVEPKGMGER